MKTLQIGLDWFPERAGGLQRIFYDLIQTFPAQGVDVRGVVAGSPDVAADTNGRVEAFSAVNKPLWVRMLAARRAIGRVINQYEPDLIASHFSLYTLPALNLIDCPIVVHFHGPWALEGEVEQNGDLRRRIKAWVEGRVYHRAKVCIVLSKAFGTILHERYEIPWDQIRIIPGAVDLKRFTVSESQPDARQRLGWPADRPIILSIRRLVRRMGLENLIAAMSEVVRGYPDVLLLIGGRGPMASDLATEIVERGLERNVRLLGFISDDDLPNAYRAADFSIVPTAALEGFGLIAVESLAVGTPVLVTPVGALREVVQDLSEALIFPGTSASDIALHIIDVLSGGVKLPNSQFCQSYAYERYGRDLMIERIKAVYAEAI